MYSISYKNTFLSFGEQENEARLSTSTSRSASPRSRSLECNSKARQSEEEQACEMQLRKLNEMLIATQRASTSDVKNDEIATCSPSCFLPHVPSASTMADEFDGISEMDQVEFNMTIEEISTDTTLERNVISTVGDLQTEQSANRRCRGCVADGSFPPHHVEHEKLDNVAGTRNTSPIQGCEHFRGPPSHQSLPNVTSSSTLADDWSEHFERMSEAGNVEFDMKIEEVSADCLSSQACTVMLEEADVLSHSATIDGEIINPATTRNSAEVTDNHGNRGSSTSRALFRVSCRNTFLSFDEEEEEDECRVLPSGKRAASPRSNSLDSGAKSRSSKQACAYEEQLRKLNDVLASPRSNLKSQANEAASVTRAAGRTLHSKGREAGCREVAVSTRSEETSNNAGDVAVCKCPPSREYRHGQVPKNINLAVEYRNSSNDRPATTLMIRNIPNRYTQRELIKELEDLGFADAFDFLYLPVDKGTMASVGYAFVNFLLPESAERCMEAFQNYRFKKHGKATGKVAAISVAHIQGLDANLAHYEKAAVSTAKLKQRRPWVRATTTNSTIQE